MKNNIVLPYILGILMLTILLLLIEWYIIAIVFCFIAIPLVIIIAKDNNKDKNENKKHNTTRQTNRQSYKNNTTNNNWNGYSDPNDFPTDGYSNNGW